MSIFRWDTLKEIGAFDLSYRVPIKGTECEIELVGGTVVRVWRAEDGAEYFCHGLTFGGKEAPGAPISPFTGEAVETILQHHFNLVPETVAQTGDILVWKGSFPETTPHSAVLVDPQMDVNLGRLHETTGVQTKNGNQPEATTTLETLIRLYGESYVVYRRR